MRPGLYAAIEQALKAQMVNALDSLQLNWEMVIEVFKIKKDMHTKVYGRYAGANIEEYGEPIRAGLTGDVWTTSGANQAGLLNSVYMYSDSDIPQVGDLIRVTRSDKMQRSFRVETRDTVGQTTEILHRFKLSGVNS